MATFEEIKQMPDAEKQAKEVQEFIGRGVKTLADARTVRVTAVEALYAAGWTQAEIGKHMGLSQVAVSRIINPPEPKPKPPKQPRVSRARNRRPKDT